MFGIDLFSGAGGMSLGALWAGVQVQIAVEADQHAAQTFKTNHPGIKVINRPIQRVEASDLQVGLRPLIVFGGPPCQGFSTSNQRTRSTTNPLNWLFREYMRLVRKAMPDWVVFENVTGIIVTERGRFLETILSEFKGLGYQTHHFVLNAVHFGIP